jgi:hypothetical protein
MPVTSACAVRARSGRRGGTAPNVPAPARAAVEKAREVIASVRPGATEARRSLPIRSDADEIRRLWADADARTAVLEGIPVADATLDFGPRTGDWGMIVTVSLRLERAMPGMATNTLAGKVVRRLKALAETGEVPTTARNPSARDDAGKAPA